MKLQLWKKSLGMYESQYDIVKISDDYEGVKVYLSTNGIDQASVLVDFSECRVLAYRSFDESFWVTPLYALIKDYGEAFICNNTFFEVSDSDFAKEVSSWGFGGQLVPDLHLIIMGSNTIFEAVSFGEPDIVPIQPEF